MGIIALACLQDDVVLAQPSNGVVSCGLDWLICDYQVFGGDGWNTLSGNLYFGDGRAAMMVNSVVGFKLGGLWAKVEISGDDCEWSNEECTARSLGSWFLMGYLWALVYLHLIAMTWEYLANGKIETRSVFNAIWDQRAHETSKKKTPVGYHGEFALYWVLATGLVMLNALQQNINYFYSPSRCTGLKRLKYQYRAVWHGLVKARKASFRTLTCRLT